MKKLVLLAAVAAHFCLPSQADQLDEIDRSDCRLQGCRASFLLFSTSELRKYGVLIAAPDTGCRRMRFRVETLGKIFLGHTPPLGPGERAVVRMGRSFPAGEHMLSIATEGCAALPATTRRVTLAKLSPDHGWRAAN